jgi:hypothetical protein
MGGHADHHRIDSFSHREQAPAQQDQKQREW